VAHTEKPRLQANLDYLKAIRGCFQLGRLRSWKQLPLLDEKWSHKRTILVEEVKKEAGLQKKPIASEQITLGPRLFGDRRDTRKIFFLPLVICGVFIK